MMYKMSEQYSVLDMLALFPDNDLMQSLSEEVPSKQKKSSRPIGSFKIPFDYPWVKQEQCEKKHIICGSLVKKQEKSGQSKQKSAEIRDEKVKIMQQQQLKKQFAILSKLYQKYEQEKIRLQKQPKKQRQSRRKRKFPCSQMVPNLAAKKATCPTSSKNSRFKSQRLKLQSEQKCQDLRSTQQLSKQNLSQKNRQISLTDTQQLILILAKQLGMMNSSMLKTILPISSDQAQAYLLKNFYRIRNHFRFTVQCYQTNMAMFYEEPNPVLVTLLDMFFQKNGFKLEEYLDELDSYPLCLLQNGKTLLNYKWQELKES